MGGIVPTEYGGSGLDFVSNTIILEEISRACHAVACALSFPSGLAGSALLRFGSEEQKQKYLKPLAKGEIFAATGVTEPHSGTDVAAMQTVAVERWRRLHLQWLESLDQLSRSGQLSADLCYARPRNPRKNICAFLIDRDTPGLKFKPYKNKLGFRPLSTGDVFLDDVRVPASARVGREGEGLKVAMCAVENGRLGVAARAVGLGAGLSGCFGASMRRIASSSIRRSASFSWCSP